MLQQLSIEIGLSCLHVAIEPKQFSEYPIIRLRSQLNDKHRGDRMLFARTTSSPDRFIHGHLLMPIQAMEDFDF
jgi:hypothetical protein